MSNFLASNDMDKTNGEALDLNKLEALAKAMLNAKSIAGAMVAQGRFHDAITPAAALELIALARAGTAAPAAPTADQLDTLLRMVAQGIVSVDAAKARLAAPAAPTDLTASGLLKLWERAVSEATDTMPTPFVFARLLLAAPAAAVQPSDPVVEANRKLLLDRSRVGINKYGVTLAGAGLSRGELVQHALEEALDLANYLQTIIQAEAAATPEQSDTTKGQA